jgi:MFS family permease
LLSPGQRSEGRATDRGGVLRRAWPSYRWTLVGTLGFTELIAFGALQFAFSALLVPMETELGWSRTVLTGAYSLGVLMSGIAAIPVGAVIDRHGPRAIMIGGAVLASLLLLAWAEVRSVYSYYAIWAALGLCMAAVLYEPAFTVVTRWFGEDRGRALGWLTMIAALSSTIFVPGTAWLVARADWRVALQVLAAVLFLGAVLPLALVLRPNPEPLLPHRPGAWPPDLSVAVRSRAFRHLGFAFSLSAFAAFGLYVHFIPLVVGRGLSAGSAALALGMAGVMKLPGRALFTLLAKGQGVGRLTTLLLGAQGAGLLALVLLPVPAGAFLGAALFGLGDGGLTPARAAIMGERFGYHGYGAMIGALGLLLSLSRAAAPFSLSLLEGTGIGYAGVLAGLACGIALAMVAVQTVDRSVGVPDCVLSGPSPST